MNHLLDVKKDFPIFTKHPSLVYLDSSATSLKPGCVINALTKYYSEYSANVARSLYTIAEKATQEVESSRKIIAQFINAKPEEIVFTKNATEGLNLSAYVLTRQLKEGDEIVITEMEHHSNYLPWMYLCKRHGLNLKKIPLDKTKAYLEISPNSKVSIQKLRKYITRKTKVVAITWVSNVLGTINPISEITNAIRSINPNIIIVLDVAQGVPHLHCNVQELGVDIMAFSAHKMLGPTGLGVLYIKHKLIERLEPFLLGGGMILDIQGTKMQFKDNAYKFEAGTPPIAEIIAFKSAIKYLQKIGMKKIREHEEYILSYMMQKLHSIKGLSILGPENIKHRSGLIAFTISSCHPHDTAQILGDNNIAVRAGHHCAIPLHCTLGVVASTRASIYLYNTTKDCDFLHHTLIKVKRLLTYEK